MKKTHFKAAVVAGAMGLGIAPAFGQASNECDVSSQPDHQYTDRFVPHDRILNIQKRTVSTADGYSTTEEIGKNGKTVRRPVKAGCADSASYVLYAKKADFDRLKEEGRITASTSVRFTPSGNPVRACLDIPVKANRVVDMGKGGVSIHFTPDENIAMRGERVKYVYTFNSKDRNFDVYCYSFDFGEVAAPVSKPKVRPVIVKPPVNALKDVPAPVVTPKPSQPNFFQSLFGG